MKKYSVPLLISVISTPIQPLFAAETDPLRVNVTASRISYPVDRTAASVSKLTRKEIEERNITTLVEAIATLPGVYVAQSGSLGSATAVYLRGAESNHTVILINGVRATSSVSGYAELQYIPLSSVESIEVVRGGLSTLYGSNAIGGVIQIFTTDTLPKDDQLNLAIGSQNTAKASLIKSAQFDNGGRYKLSLLTERTSGFDTASASWSSPDADGMRNRALNIDIRAPLKKWTFDFSGRYNNGLAEWDNGETEFKTHSLSTSASHPLGNGKLKATAAATQTDHNNSIFEERPFGTQQYKLEYEHNLNTHLTTLYGIERLNEHTTDLDLSSSAVFTAANFIYGKHSTNASIRLEEQEKFGTHVTKAVGYAYSISNATELFGSYRESFAAPSFEDYIYDVNKGANISPETAKTYEIGLRHNVGLFSIASSLFKTSTKNLIKAEKVDPNCFWPCDYAYRNIDRSETRGLEIESSYSSGNASMKLNYTYLDAANLSNGSYLARRPMHNAAIVVNYALSNRTQMYVSGNLRRDMYDMGNKLPPLVLWTVSGKHSINENLDIGLRVDNLFDEDYESLAGYPGRERYVELTASYRF